MRAGGEDYTNTYGRADLGAVRPRPVQKQRFDRSHAIRYVSASATRLPVILMNYPMEEKKQRDRVLFLHRKQCQAGSASSCIGTTVSNI